MIILSHVCMQMQVNLSTCFDLVAVLFGGLRLCALWYL